MELEPEKMLKIFIDDVARALDCDGSYGNGYGKSPQLTVLSYNEGDD